MADRPLAPGESGYGLQAPTPDAEPVTRSFPRAAIDFGLNVGKIIPETYQTAVEGGRTLFGGDQPTGWWQRRAKEAGDTMDWYKGLSSEADRQAGERKFFPGVDDQSAWQDLPAVAAHQIAGLVPYLFSGLAAKAVTKTPEAAAKVAKIFNIGGMGAQTYGAYNQALRDYFEKTPVEQLIRTVPGFGDLHLALGEEGARNEAYKKAYSPTAAVLNAAVGAGGGAGISHAVGGMGMKLLPRTLVGGAEGLGIGGALGAAGEYGRQKGLVNVGAQGAIDTEKVYRSAAESALPMGAIVGTAHAWTGKYDPTKADGKKAETPPPSGGPPMAETEALTEAGIGGTPSTPSTPGAQGELNIPQRPPSDQYGLAMPLPQDRPRFTGYQPPEPPPEPPPPPGPEQGRLDLRAPPRSIGGMGELGEYAAHLEQQEATLAAQRVLAQRQAAGYARAAEPAQVDPEFESRIRGQRQAAGLAGAAGQEQLARDQAAGYARLAEQRAAQPQIDPDLFARVRQPPEAIPPEPAGRFGGMPQPGDFPPYETAPATQAVQPQGPAKPIPGRIFPRRGGGGGQGPPPPPPPAGGGPRPVGGGTAVARERARAAQAAPKVEQAPARTLKAGDTIVDPQDPNYRVTVISTKPTESIVRLEGTTEDLRIAHTPGEKFTVERAAAAPTAAEAKPAAPTGEPQRPAKIAKDAKHVGKNADGIDVWERPDGTRQYIRPSDGFVVNETVMGDRPGGAKVGDYTARERPAAFETEAAKPVETKPAEAKPPEAKPAAPAKEPTAEDHIRQVIGHAAGGDANIRDRWATRLRNIAHANKGRLEYGDLPPELKTVLTDSPLLRRLMDDPKSFDRLVSGAGHMEVPELPAGLRREAKPEGAARVAETSQRRTAEKKGEEPKAATGAVTEAEAVAKMHPSEREHYDALKKEIADEKAGHNDPDFIAETQERLTDFLEEHGVPRDNSDLPPHIRDQPISIRQAHRKQQARHRAEEREHVREMSPDVRAAYDKLSDKEKEEYHSERRYETSEAKRLAEIADTIVPDWVPPNKPKGFDDPVAKELRERLDLPQSWEALVQRVKGSKMIRYLEDQAEVLLRGDAAHQRGSKGVKPKVAITEQGRIVVGRRASDAIRTRRKRIDREPVIETALDDGWEGENKRELLTAAMGRVVADREIHIGPLQGRPYTEVPGSVSIRGVVTPTITRVPGKPNKALRRLFDQAIKDNPRPEGEKPPVVDTAVRALDVMTKQMTAWVSRLTDYLNEPELSGRKDAYVHGESYPDEVFFIPKPEEPRSGGAASSYWSRLVMINAKRKLFNDLLEDWAGARTNTQRVNIENRLRRQLRLWGRDETVGPIVAHGERRSHSAFQTEERAQPRFVDEHGQTWWGLEALEIGGQGARMVDEAGTPLSAEQAAESGGILQGVAPAMPLDAADVGIWTQNIDKMTHTATLARKYLEDFDAETARRVRAGEKTLTREQLVGFMRLLPKERLTMEQLKEQDPYLHDALLETSQRPVPVYDPETGGQKLIVKAWDADEGTWHDTAAPDQHVRDSLLAAEKQRAAAGQEATGIGTLGEAMIRDGAASEEMAEHLVANPETTSVEWARENSLQLGTQLNDILRHTAAHLNATASDLRRVTGFENEPPLTSRAGTSGWYPRHLTEAEMEARAAEGYQRTEAEGYQKLELGPKREATVSAEARRRAAEQAAAPVEPAREQFGMPTQAAHLEEVATLLTDLAPDAFHYEQRLPAINALMRMIDDPQVSMHLTEDLVQRANDWLQRYHHADITLAAIDKLTPGRLSVARAEAPVEGRGEPVLTPVTSGVGLAPSDLRARVGGQLTVGGRQAHRPSPRPDIGQETVVHETPSKGDVFVPMPDPSKPWLPENVAAVAQRTGIYEQEGGRHKISPQRNIGMPTPARETVVQPTRPGLAEYERRRGEPAPVDERGRVGLTGEERLAEHQSVVSRITDYLFARKKPARFPEEVTDDQYVKSSPVKDLSHEIYDRNDPIDVELKKAADQTVGDVKVMVLHPDIFKSLMDRLGQTDNAGYYDWRTDTIYLNKDKSDARTMADAEAWNTLMRHEVGHAMTFGAVESNPQAKRAINQLTSILASRPRQWLSELEKMKGTDFGSPYFQEGKPVLNVAGQRAVPYTLESIKKILTDPHEFLAHLQGSKDFRRIISAAQLSGAERVQLRTPQARTIFEAAKQWIYRAVKDLFKRSRANDALTDAMAMTFEILEGNIETGRPEFNPRRKYGQTGAAGFWDGALAQKLGASGREVKRLYKKRGGTWGQKAFWTHTFEDLTRWGSEAFKAKTLPTKEIVSELYAEAHNYARTRGDETLLKALDQMSHSPQADRFADFAMRRSKMQAYTEAPLGEKDANGKATGMNAHVRLGSMLHRQIERVFPAMQAEHAKIIDEIPYAKPLLKMMDEWGEKVARDDALAVIHDTAGMDNITRGADGNIDPLAQSAFEKHVVNHKDTPLTAAEQAWIDSKRGPDPRTVTGEKAKQDAFLKRINFDKLVASYRDNPDLARRAGPWVPFKRFGDLAIGGDYIFPAINRDEGRHISDGMFEFYGDDPAKAFIDKVTDTSGVKLLDTDRVVYVKDPSKPREEWVEAQKENVERSQWEGGNVNEPGYVVTTSEGTRRVSPKEAEKDPNFEIRRRLNFNNQHLEFFRKEREAQEKLDALTNPKSPHYNPHVKMRPEVELVSDYGGSQSPHYMSRAMRGLMENALNSWEYKRMTTSERQAWKQRLMTAAAKQVMMAGGRAPGLMREYVEGQSRDLLETYAMASAQSAFNHAHYKHGQRLRDAFKAIDEFNTQHEFAVGSSDRRAINEELQRRAYAVHDPFVHGIWGTATNRLLQFTYTAKLAGFSFLGLNLMEPSLIHLPMLAAKVGPWQAFRLYKGAYSDLAGRKILFKGLADFKKALLNRDGKWSDYEETFAQNLRDSKAPDAEEAIRMFDILLGRGVFDRSSVNEVTVLRAQKPTWAGKVLDWADNSFRGLNTGVEALNRGVIALSEFRAAKGTFEERVRAAEAAVYKGAGIYAAWNAPPIFNHPVGRLATQFKKYPQRIISNHIAALMAGLNGETPEIRRQGLLQLGYMLGTTAMVAGMMGLPTEVFSIPFNALSILGLGPSWNDITTAAYGVMANQLGPEAAEIIAHGAPRAFNVDLSGRAGQNNLIFFDQPQSNKPQDLKASAAGFLLGAGGSSMANGIEGIQYTAKALSEAVSGSNQRAWEYAMRGARDLMFIKTGVNILDAIRGSGATGGMKNLGGAALGPELTAGETAMKILGVQSGREARYWEGRQVEQRREKASQESRNTWVQRMATATPAERPRIQSQINEWNQTHGLADQVKPSEITKAISRRRTEEARPRSELAMPRNKRYETERQDVSRIYNLQGL